MIHLRDNYQYCTKCRTQLEAKKSYKLCPGCGQHYFFNAKPTASIILTNQQNQLLMTKRSRNPFKEWWDLPGGFVEANETLEQAAHRELLEETGINITDFQYVGSFNDDYLYQGVIIPVVSAVFGCKLPTNTCIKVGDDVKDYKFVDIKSINLKEVAFNAQRAFLKRYLNNEI